MPDIQYENYYSFVLYICQQPIVSDAVTPLTALIADKGLSILPRIGAAFKVLSYPCSYKKHSVPVQFFQRL